MRYTGGCIVSADGVGGERIDTGGGVLTAIVRLESEFTHSRIVKAGRV